MRSTQVPKGGLPEVDSAPAIIVGYRQGVTVLELLGEHDTTTAENLTFNILEQVVRGNGVVVSLSEAEFIDSSIIRALFQGDQEMLRTGRRLVLFGGDNDTFRRVFEVACVTDELVYCDSFEEALEFASRRFKGGKE